MCAMQRDVSGTAIVSSHMPPIEHRFSGVSPALLDSTAGGGSDAAMPLQAAVLGRVWKVFRDRVFAESFCTVREWPVLACETFLTEASQVGRWWKWAR